MIIFIRKHIAGTIVIIIGYALAYWLNSDGWLHPSLNVLIGVVTGVVSRAFNDIVWGMSSAADCFKRGFNKGWNGKDN